MSTTPVPSIAWADVTPDTFRDADWLFSVDDDVDYLTHRTPGEAMLSWLDDGDLVHVATTTEPLLVYAYQPARPTPAEEERVATDLCEWWRERWSEEYGDPDGDWDADGLTSEAALAFVRATVATMVAWRCDLRMEVVLSANEVRALARAHYPVEYAAAEQEVAKGAAEPASPGSEAEP